MIERLPTPWGLVRLGVAPDHPKLKSVSRAFERIADKPGFRFLGNVEVGRDLHHDDLARLYDAVVYAVGAQTDRRLGIPGEDLPGLVVGVRVRRLVQRPPGLPGPRVRPRRRARGRDRERQRRAGRRAHARADAPRSSRRPTRPTRRSRRSRALAHLRTSSSSAAAGRRRPRSPPRSWRSSAISPARTSSSTRRLSSTAPAREDADTRVKRNLEVLRDFAARDADRQAEDAQAALPRLAGRDPRRRPRRGGRDRAQPPRGARRPHRRRADRTSARRFRAASSSAASATAASRCRACRSTRRAARSATTAAACSTTTGEPLRGVYCAGWIKRGPTGIIGTNKKDATETVELLLEDVRAGRLAHDERATAEAVDALLDERGVRRVVYAGWQAIDALERSRGEPLGRPRVKLVTWDELLDAAETVAAPAETYSPRRGSAPHPTGADGQDMASKLVECLNCGATRRVVGDQASRPGSRTNARRCGYVGWAETESLTESLRRALRDHTLDQRRRVAAW